MVTIIKNQLLKHLSRYLKNLSAEQISLSALRGSGELSDLALEEALLTELLELPGWLRITAATCNRASFRIQWTKLKTVPIVLNLDEVHVALEVCEEPRASAAPDPVIPSSASKYSYIHKVIDGISVAVNSVQVDFSCAAFTGSAQLSRLLVESRTPQWQRADLRLTRLKSPDTGQLLIFKEVEWQTARVEARARAATDLPPLRLLAGAATTRIVIKKRLSDCSVLGSRLVVRPEPLAWALTDGQLRAALACAAALAAPVRRATAAATRAKALRKLQSVGGTESGAGPQVSGEDGGGSRDPRRDALARLFARHDVRETSYHVLAPRLDLHLCDDPSLGRSTKPSLAGGGALQLTVLGLQADFYPYHRTTEERRHWRGYREAATPHTQWLSQTLSAYCSSLLEACAPLPTTDPSTHNGFAQECVSPEAPPESPRSPRAPADGRGGARARLLAQVGRLMTTCLVLRVDDLTVYRVATGAGGREPARALLCAERATLPGDAGLLHAEFTHFYCPGDAAFPTPAPQLYVQLSPVRAHVDVESLVWLGAFLPHVARAAAAAAPAVAAPDAPFYADVRMEAIMPKLVVEAGAEHVSAQRDRPRELHVCAARVAVSNVREPLGPGSRPDLADTLHAIRCSAPPPHEFPCTEDDEEALHPAFDLHAQGLDDVERAAGPEMLWTENRSIWSLRAEPAWADFCGARATNGKPTPLLDAVPLSAWLHTELRGDGLRVHALARAGGLVGLQLNHYQLLFLLRQADRLSELVSWVTRDAARVASAGVRVAAAAALPALELTMVLPAACAGRESSRDLDSVLPDTSSLQELRAGGCSEVAMVGLAGGAVDTVPSCVVPEPATPPSYRASSVRPPSASGAFPTLQGVRRGLSSLVTSLDSALSRDDSLSTASSDSELVVVGLEDSPHDADSAFREWDAGTAGMGGGIEVAAEVVERSSSPSEHSASSSCRRRDLVGTTTARVTRVHARVHSVADVTRAAISAAHLQLDECAAIPWDEFQSKFAMRARAYSSERGDDDAAAGGGARAARPRLAALYTRRPDHELLEARLEDISLTLSSAAALALAEFAEDELQGPSLPLVVSLERAEVTLLPPPASPAPPLRVELTGLSVARDARAALAIAPLRALPHTEPSGREQRLVRENEELRRRLALLTRVADDNHVLRARAKEAASLRECAHAAQREAAALLADKRVLLDRVRSLQQQLGAACLGARDNR